MWGRPAACSAAARGALATGVDANPAMLAAARDRAEERVVKASFDEGRIERLPFPDGAFDVVSAVTALCLVVDAEPAFREMARVLRPGGRLVVGELGRRTTLRAEFIALRAAAVQNCGSH
jgi:ubiquinone/menaquinone biosynthesis C-methylase UbiE